MILLKGGLEISYKIGGHIITLGALTFLICLLCFVYSRSIQKHKDYSRMSRFTFLVFYAIRWIRRNTYQIVGKRYKIAIPFFIYIVLLFWFSNLISILGFDSIGNSLVIPMSLSFVVFVGTVLSGLIHRGWRFFGDYIVWLKYKGKKVFPIIDPLKLIGELSKVLSLSFRLWGNSLAGSLILFVVYTFSENILKNGLTDYVGPIVVALFVFPLHIYFDVVAGTIQPLIFMLLTMCYWSMARHGEGARENDYDLHKEDQILG